jgi:YD repeat-containing protein
LALKCSLARGASMRFTLTLRRHVVAAVFGLMVVFLLLLSVNALSFGQAFTASESTVQQAQLPPLDRPNSADRLCADVRTLMRANTTPSAMLVGGGSLRVGQTVEGALNSADWGDTWSFIVQNATASTTAGITISNLTQPLELEMTLYRGLNRVSPTTSYQTLTSGETLTLTTSRNGIYTLVIRAADFAAAAALTEPLRYNLRVDYQGSDEVAAALPNLRNETTRLEFEQGRDFRYADGQQVITFASGGEFAVNPGSVQAVASRENAAGQLIFAEGGSLLIDSWARSISLVGGDLSVIGVVDELPRVFYLENYGARIDLVSPLQSALAEFTDSNRTRFAADWRGITGIWVTVECVGVRFDDGTTFVAPLEGISAERRLSLLGAGTNDCPQIAMNFRAADAEGEPVDHSGCIVRSAIEVGSEFSWQDGVFYAQLPAERQLVLETRSFAMQPLEAAYADDGESAPLRIAMTAPDGRAVSLAFDWRLLAVFSYFEGALRFDFLDAPRTSTRRDGANLRSLEAVGDVIHMVDQGDNPPERLLFGGDESYLEIITPGGEPTFDGAPFDARALPGTPGFGASALNNLGGECYPANTVLPQANCPSAGEVNPANGSLWYRVVDHRAMHLLGDLTLSRSYNSAMYQQDSPFGYGWTTEYLLDYNVAFDATANTRPIDGANADPETRLDYRVGLDLTWTPRGVVTVTTPSGSRHVFVRRGVEDGREVFASATMPTWRLIRDGAGITAITRSDWRLELPDGFVYRYDRAGRLLSFGDEAHGHQVTIGYPYTTQFDGAGAIGEATPVVITDQAERRQIELYYNRDHRIVRSILRDLTLSTVGEACEAADNCFEARYSYDGGRLVEVAYPGGQTAVYRYDAVGRLIAHDDPRAPLHPRMAYRYVGEFGGSIRDVYGLRPEDSLPTEIGAEVPYIPLRTIFVEETNAERRAVVTDFYGAARTYTYRLAAGDLFAARDAYTLIAVSSPLAIAEPFESVPTRYTWDDGLLIAQSFRALPQLSSRGRNAIDYSYDAAGNLIGVRGGLAGFTAAVGDPASGQPRFLPSSITFADGTSLAYQYDDAGSVIGLADRDGAVYQFILTDAELPLAITRANDGMRWEYRYDDEEAPSALLEVVQRSSDADSGYRTRYAYDALGRVVQVDDQQLGMYSIAHEPMMQQEDGTFRRAIVVSAPDGSVTHYRYDGRDRLIETLLLPNAGAGEQGFLRRTTYTYDPNDPLERLSAAVRWLIELNTGEQTPIATTYSYAAQPELNEVGTSSYIGGWRLTETSPTGREHSVVYDALGRVRLFSEGVRVRRYDYDVQNVRNPAPNATDNVNGLRILEREWFGGSLTAQAEYVFDFAWQLTGVRRQQGNPLPLEGDAPWTAEWRLTPNTITAVDSRLRLLQAPLLGLPTLEWDGYNGGVPTSVEVGRSIPGSSLPQNTDRQTQRDFLGRPLSVGQTVTGSPEIARFAYCPQPEGRLSVVRAALGTEASCEQGDSITLDAHGRIVEARDSAGIRAFVYTVDAERGGTRVRVTHTPTRGAAFAWTLFYDPAGDLVSWTDDAGVTRQYVYDTLGRLRRIAVPNTPDASFTLNYTPDGYLTERVDDLGRGTRYYYNDQGRLTVRQNTSTGDAFSYLYDVNERLTGIISPSGAVTTYQYADSVDPERVTAIISPIGRDEYVWDDEARTITHIDGVGSATVYRFDGLGLLTDVQNPLGRTQTIAYDEAGRLLSWTTADASATASYGAAYDPFAGLVIVTTPDQAESWEFSFNREGALTGVVSPDGQSARWLLDPTGRLSAITLPGGTNERVTRFERGDQTPTLNVIAPDGALALEYDALFRQVSGVQGVQQTALTYQPIQEEALINIRLETPLETRYYTFAAGNDRQPQRVTVRTDGRRTIYTYDEEGRLIGIEREICLNDQPFDLSSVDLGALRVEDQGACASEDAEVQRTQIRIVYEERGLPIRRIDEADAVETFTYDSRGNLVSYQDSDGRTTSYSYDALNRLTRLSTPSGEHLYFAYALDQVTGVCESLNESLDYAGCAAAGGVLVSAPTAPGSDVVVDVGLDAGLITERDSLGRVSGFRVEDRRLSFTYDDDGLGYTIEDAQTGASIAFRFLPSLLVESISARTSGSEGETVLEIAYFGQESDGVLPFSLLWGNGDLLDFRVDRRGEALFVDFIGADSALTVDYADSPQGIIRRSVITGDGIGLGAEVDGYTVIFGYDQAGSPLTIRVTDTASGRLIYQSSFVYSSLGQLQSETRDYQDGTTVDILYRYQDGAQLAERETRVSPQTGGGWTQTLRYEYDARGSLSAVTADGETCALFNYDTASRLIGATVGDNETRYSYDALGRLTTANRSRFLYLGDERQPFAVMNSQGTTFLVGLTGDIRTGAPLFAANADGIQPFLYGGRGQVFGTSGNSADAPLWLFDPYRRPVMLTPPSAPESPCAAASAPEGVPAYLPLFGDALWDTQNHLLFIDGRAYAPDMARFLQPDPAGVDAAGRRYEWSDERLDPPVRITLGADRRGLAALLELQTLLTLEDGLTAEALAASALPSPFGRLDLAWERALQQQTGAFQERLDALLAFPTWLSGGYNLQGTQLDPSEGVIRIADAPAPGQMSGAALLVRPIDSAPFAPVALRDHGAALHLLLDRQRFAAAAPTVYRRFAWRDDSGAHMLPFDLTLPQVTLADTPSAVLARLPRALNARVPDGASVLALLAEVERLPDETLDTWLERVYMASLPTLPPDLSEQGAVWQDAGISRFSAGLRLPNSPPASE